MADLKLYAIADLSKQFIEIRVNDDKEQYYSFDNTPQSLVIFTQGRWPMSSCDASIEAKLIMHDGSFARLGFLKSTCKSICWELADDPNLDASAVNDPARLRLDVKGMEGNDSQDSGFEGTSSQNQNEDVILISTPTSNKQRKRPNTKCDRTPNGPTPKKQRTATPKVKKEAKLSKVDENIMKLNVSSSLKPAVTTSLKPTGDMEKVTTSLKPMGDKEKVATCKHVGGKTPQPTSRWGHTLCMIHDNRAALVGGQGEKQQLSKDSVWVLDPETRKWKFPDAKCESGRADYRMGHTCTYDPQLRCLYVYGGSKNLKWFNDVHILDLDEWKWQLVKTTGKAPTRAYHSANLYHSEMWVFGGVYPRPDPQPDGCSNDINIYSPVMENWYTPITNGTKPIPRSGHSSTLVGERLIIFGGWDAPEVYNDLHILDMGIVEWSQPDVKGTPPDPRSWHAACALSNNRILIHGGYDGDLALSDTHILDLGCLSWSRIKLEPSPTARAGHSILCLPYNHENTDEDEVLVFGGGDNDGEYFKDLFSLTIPFKSALVDDSEISNPDDNVEKENIDSSKTTVTCS